MPAPIANKHLSLATTICTEEPPEGQTKAQRVAVFANSVTARLTFDGPASVITFRDGSTIQWDGASGVSATEANPAKAFTQFDAPDTHPDVVA